MEYKLSKLKDVTTYIARGITPKYTEDLTGLCVINQKCIRDYKLLLENARRHDISKKQITDEKVVQKYDILINSTGVGTAGRVTQNFENQMITADSHVTIVRPDFNKINPIYLGYAVKNQQKYIEGLAEGSTGQTEISRQRIGEEILIKFPTDKQVQKIISDFLLNVDKKINLNTQINDNLYKALNMIFQEYFCNKQDDENFEKIQLKDLISIRGGLAYKASLLSDNVDDNILVSMGNVELNTIFNFNNLKHYSENVENRYVGKIGDLFICTRDVTQKRNQLGCPGIIPKIFKGKNVIIGTNLYIVDILNNKKNFKYFLYLLMNSNEYRERIVGSAKGTAVLMIAKDDILKFEFCYPKEEKIIDDFNNKVTPIFEKIESIIVENDRLSNLRDTLLPKLMNGEIDLDKIEI